MLTKKDFTIPKRKNKKGQNGKVLIVGGSRNYVGALALAGHAALRAGTDWVTIATIEKVAWAINCLSQDLVTYKLKGTKFKKEHIKEILDLEKKHNTLLIGNGMGTNSHDIICNIVKKSTLPLIIDADAIKAISLKDVNNSILTPHKQEFKILLKNSNLTLNNFQKNLKNNILVLKGPIDRIYTKNNMYQNNTGNPGMSKAGTGDVLAGLISGFKSQGLTSLQAAINGTYINGLLGDNLKKTKGYSYIASDLLEEAKKLI